MDTHSIGKNITLPDVFSLCLLVFQNPVLLPEYRLDFSSPLQSQERLRSSVLDLQSGKIPLSQAGCTLGNRCRGETFGFFEPALVCNGLRQPLFGLQGSIMSWTEC